PGLGTQPLTDQPAMSSYIKATLQVAVLRPRAEVLQLEQFPNPAVKELVAAAAAARQHRLIRSWIRWGVTTCTRSFPAPLMIPFGVSVKIHFRACWCACNAAAIRRNHARQPSSEFLIRVLIRAVWISTAKA